VQGRLDARDLCLVVQRLDRRRDQGLEPKFSLYFVLGGSTSDGEAYDFRDRELVAGSCGGRCLKPWLRGNNDRDQERGCESDTHARILAVDVLRALTIYWERWTTLERSAVCAVTRAKPVVVGLQGDKKYVYETHEVVQEERLT
jgi:hypothetical protein